MELIDDFEFKHFPSKPKGYTDQEWETRRKVLETRMMRDAGLSVYDSDYELLAEYMEDYYESEQ